MKTPTRAVLVVRKGAGALLLVGLGALVVAVVADVRRAWREHSGAAEGEAGLAVILDHVASAYARRGRLCGSSRLELAEGWENVDLLDDARATVDAERDADVGFACLGLDGTARLARGHDMYSYESDGVSFRARAFRAYLYDPYGVLPRYEVSGRVEAGKLVVDGRVRRIEPGGPRFLGHPDAAP